MNMHVVFTFYIFQMFFYLRVVLNYFSKLLNFSKVKNIVKTNSVFVFIVIFIINQLSRFTTKTFVCRYFTNCLHIFLHKNNFCHKKLFKY